MPIYTADALILRTYKLAEADRIVVFLTSDRGKRRGVAKGARRTRSRFTGGLEPFTQVQLAYFERENRDLVRLSYVEPVASPLVSQSGDALGYVSYFAELVDAWALEGDPSERLYRLGVSVIEAITCDVPVERVARYFEYWLLRLQGVYPSVAACQRCRGGLDHGGAVIVRDLGAFVCQKCGSDDGEVDLTGDALSFLRAAASRSAMDMGVVPFTPDVARQLTTVHRRLLETHLQKQLKSARVLHELGAWTSGVRPTDRGSE